LDLGRVLLEEGRERIGLMRSGETFLGCPLSFEYVPQAQDQVDISRAMVDSVCFLACLFDLALQSCLFVLECREPDGVAGGVGEAAPNGFEIGQEPIGRRVCLTCPSQLEALLLQIAHGPRSRAALAEDAGGEEQLAHLVSRDCLGAREVRQVDGEHSAKKRLVCPAKGLTQLVLRACASVGAPYGELFSGRGVALDSPLSCDGGPALFLAQCEPPAMAPPSNRGMETGIVTPARQAEEHRSQEVEQSRLTGLVRAAQDHQPR
jgi:hypothetical protein